MAQRPLGPYLIEQRLATGGMAEVFVAKRVGPHGFYKRVALKRILPQFSKDPDFVAMFIDEARLAARLEHPNIVQVFDFGELGGDLFLAMELVDGTNVNRLLRSVSARGESVPLDVALHVVSETADALAYAHKASDEQGKPLAIVHRDVSPANILLTRTGHVKLSDFGIARVAAADHRTDDGHVRGKLGYMSPEQVMGKAMDGRSDVFTLATVLAEMLIAEPLFGTGTDLDVLLRIRDTDLRALDQSPRRIPQDVRTLLRQALAREPRERFSASQFAEQVDQILRRRGAAGGERLARLLLRLELVSNDGTLPTNVTQAAPTPATPAGVAGAGGRPTNLVDTTGVSPQTERLIGELGITSPAIYKVQTRDGATLGPISFPKLVEMITTGKIDADCKIAREEGPFQAAGALPELTRFVNSPALQWRKEETADAVWRGELGAARLLPIVFKLFADRETGVLHLVDAQSGGTRRKKIYFVDGRPEFVASTDHSELLGEWLVTTGMCLKMEVEMALALLPRYGGRLGDALVGLGVLRPVELFRAIAAQVRARFLEAFRWRRGEYFYVRGVRSHEETFPLGLDPIELLRDAAGNAHNEELEAALAPVREQILSLVPVPPIPMDAFRLGDAQQLLLRGVKGDTTFAAILARETAAVGSAKKLDADDVYRAFYLGLSCGLIRAG